MKVADTNGDKSWNHEVSVKVADTKATLSVTYVEKASGRRWLVVVDSSGSGRSAVETSPGGGVDDGS